MFVTLTQKILLGIYIFVVLSIPIGAYLVSQQQTIKSRAEEDSAPIVKTAPKPTTSPAKELLSTTQSNLSNTLLSTPQPSPEASTPTIATSFGPTLSLKISLEGRPADNQATKLFVGILEGALSTNPKFLLSFSVDLATSGEYSNLSLAGLTSGTQYTALLKGAAQIASSATFTMSPTVSNLNEGQAVTLISGDLNDDNVINSADYAIVQGALGKTKTSSGWNENIDFNLDGVINIFDLAIVSKNIGKTGESGAWTSTPAASSSASLAPSVGGPGQTSGYWLWIPK